MFSVFAEPTKAISRSFPRRELLRAGGLSLLGLTSGQLAALRARATGRTTQPPRSCIFLFLFGGPSQIDLWDMKPQAPVEVRGDFQPIATKVPGVHVCEHLPRFAQMMDKVCLLRSMTHNMNVHGPACSEVFTGREYFSAPTTDQARPEDWPSLSAMTMRFGKSHGGLPPSVVLPWYLHFTGQARRIAGQTGGRMGERHNGLLIQGDAKELNFRTDGLQLAQNVPLDRIRGRHGLLGHLETTAGPRKLMTTAIDDFQRHRDRAVSLLESDAGRMLDVNREPVAVRERYGKTMVGQSLLMARRMVEAGISLVTVNWEDETKISGTNTCWDTHQNNFSKLKTLLCPIFDEAFPAFINDLDERGLLETTLVVAIGEFGRTPHMGQFTQSSNTQKTGRDHWPHAFTAILAGGGVRGGQVYGATNRHAGFVRDKPVTPADLTATIFEHLGIDYSQMYEGEIRQLRHQLSDGKPVRDLG